MNKLISILALSALTGCAVPAKAQVFVVPNKGGGEITITTRPCIINGENKSQLREAYTWTPSYPFEKGCWGVVDGMIHIIFLKSGERRVYAISDFQEKK